ncbi:hypothetical protein EON83_06040 [bacterium]|nr:MAG: hypothetical protein EON83_06040 [bacterium]
MSLLRQRSRELSTENEPDANASGSFFYVCETGNTGFVNPLILAPWERALNLQDANGDIEQVIHDLIWNDESTSFLFQSFEVGPDKFIFARPLESSDEANWLVCQTGQDWQWGSIPRDMQNHVAMIASSLGLGDGRYSLARFCVVDRELTTPYVLLFEDGKGAWLDSWFCMYAQFGFSIDSETFRNDGGAVLRLIDELICDPDTDISFARRWATMGRDEKAVCILRGERNYERLQSVLRWTLICESALWNYARTWSWSLVYPPGSAWGGLIDPDERFWFDTSIPSDEIPFVSRIQKFLVEHYIPDMCYLLWEQHRCVLDRRSDYDDCFMQLEISGELSAHEQLEARLQLREWLEQNATLEEIEAIGPF